MFHKKVVPFAVALLCTGMFAGCPNAGTDTPDPDNPESGIVGRWFDVLLVDQEEVEFWIEFGVDGQFVESINPIEEIIGGGPYEIDTSVEPNVLKLTVYEWAEIPGERFEYPEEEQIVEYGIFELIDEGMTLRLGFHRSDSESGPPASFDDPEVGVVLLQRVDD